MVAAFPDSDLGTPPVRRTPRTVSRYGVRSRPNDLVEPLQIVPATPPVEATLRILMSSVPFLIISRLVFDMSAEALQQARDNVA